MEIQYCEGLPGVVLDEATQRMYFDTSRDMTSELEKFYENYMAENLEHFRISPDFSRGLYAMEKKLSARKPAGLKFFKNQVTGPITMGLGRVDENKRAVYYNEVFRDVIVKGDGDEGPLASEQVQVPGLPPDLLHRRADPLGLRVIDLCQRPEARRRPISP